MPPTSPKNNSRIVRFISVGTLNTLIDFSLLFLLVHASLAKPLANIVSTTVAFLFSFVANKKFTFRSHGTDIRREMLAFTVVTLFGLWGLQTLVIWIGTSVFGSSTSVLFISKLVATVVSLIWNYVMYSRLVFIKDSADGSHRS